MKTTVRGNRAETAVAERLSHVGYQVIAQNWKTKFCEIDIVAKKGDIIYFVEVKYRASIDQGSGLEYITPQKLNRIKFAVRVWCQSNSWDGDCRILATEVSGPNFENIELVEID